MQETLGKLFKNRSGAVIAGVIVAVIAVILLLLYLSSYRSSVNSGKQPVRVLVATKNIPAGTSGTLIAQQGLYTVATVQKDQLQLNAITDPSALSGRIAAASIFPGQQLTQEDFSTEAPQSLNYQLTGRQRAIAINVSANHGLVGQVTAGDTVDVYVGTSGPERHDERGQGASERAARQAPRARRVRPRRAGSRFPGGGGSPYQHPGRREVRLRIRQCDRLAGAQAGCRRLTYAALNGYPGNSARRSPVAEPADGRCDQDVRRSRCRREPGRRRARASEDGRSRDRRDGRRGRRGLGPPSRDRRTISCSWHARASPSRCCNLIDNAVTERPRRPVVVLAYGSPNGFTRQVFAAGADDMVMLPVTPDEVLFALQKAIARKAGGGEIGDASPALPSSASSARRAAPARR